MSQLVITLPQSRSLSKPERARTIIFNDPQSHALHERLKLIAPSQASTMIIGETGTGKELVARHIHDLSGRAKGPFVAVNCGAFSEQLVESEFFGHERGAFTGAVASKPGWFEVANGGTIFLDEIGDLPLTLQVKLLRVLQERSVTRIGSRHSFDIDVRVISATNVNLEEAVAAGRFRQDLYYRLNVAVIRLQPLRERRGDIPVLVDHFIKVYCNQLGLKSCELTPEAGQKLVFGHDWPGNIRELENVLHHALLVSRSNIIRTEDLNLVETRPKLETTVKSVAQLSIPEVKNEPSLDERLRLIFLEIFEKNEADSYAKMEKSLLKVAYEYCHYNQVETAKLLGISRNVLRAKLMRIGDLLPDSRFRIRAGLIETELSTI